MARYIADSIVNLLKEPFTLFNQNSSCDQEFTFLLMAMYFQEDGSQSQTQPQEENHDRLEPTVVMRTLSSDCFGHRHVMSFRATRLGAKPASASGKGFSHEQRYMTSPSPCLESRVLFGHHKSTKATC